MTVSRVGLDEQILRSLQLLEELGNEVEKLRAQVAELEAERVTAADYIGRLRGDAGQLILQVADLLPWAKAGAGNLIPFGTGLTTEDGQRLLARIDAGEFGEVAS
jgi:hypothetical protein